LQIVIENGELKIENYAGGDIAVYNIAGQTVAVETLHATFLQGTINVSHLPTGIYIVKAGGKTVKFVKK
jgi:hypothetical protein